MVSLTAEEEEKEKKEILNQYRELLRHTVEKLNDDEKKFIRKAFDLALDAHKEMRRKSGEPYIYHPIAVARIVAEEIGLGAISIACALLHDVVEDTDYTIADMERLFGKKVATIIDGLTKISGIFDQDISIQAENFRKMLLTLSDDVRVILIKLADRLHNMRTMDAMPRYKQQKIGSETLYIYAPLAHRLGLYSIKTELEDLSLKYTDPEDYKEVASQLNDTKKERITYIDTFINPLKSALKEQGIQYTIKGRPKSIFSIRKKMHKQGVSFHQVYDKFAIRIIIDTPINREKEDCWKIYSIVTDFYKPNPDRLRDWISTPKANGYESLHTTVMGPDGHWVEVQIRTERMDIIAEKGYAAHWRYKNKNPDSKKSEDNNLDDWINQIRELLENPEANALDFLDEFKLNLFSKEIFVFTPKGELITLPKGATALDFAFDIHTQLGATCLGTKVNGKLVPLSHKLNSGDQVEIISSQKQSPKENWLDFVFTARAKSKIKTALKEDKKRIAEEGKAILQRKLKSLKLNYSDKVIQELQAYFKLPTSLDLFYNIGIGTIDNVRIKEFANYKSSSWYSYIKTKFSRNKPAPFKKIAPNNKNEKQILVFGPDEEVLEYKLSPCCNPIPGDEVFGFTTIQDGIKVHSIKCPNAVRLQSNFAYRILQASWVHAHAKDALAEILIDGIDEVGLVNQVTTVISNTMSVNIRAINISSDNGIFHGKIKVFVQDKKHLNELIKKIQTIGGVKSVKRKLKG